MEDILNKNVFIDKDLEKLSPDYEPSHIVLRMEERRILTKNSHSHAHQGIIKNILGHSRKTSKRSRDGAIINKEIAKLRNGFNDMNLKNRVILKNAIKSIESSKETHVGGNVFKDDLVSENEDWNIEEFDESLKPDNLVVNNDNAFKINDKPSVRKFKHKVNIKKNVDKVSSVSHINHKNDKNEELFEVLRVECKPSKNSQIEYDTAGKSAELVDEIEINRKEEDKVIDINAALSLDLATSSYTETQIEDLQNLLVMMSLSPKPNHIHSIGNSKECENHSITTDDRNNSNSNDYEINTFKEKGEISQILNIVQFKVELNYRQKYVMTKYLKKWRYYVINKKSYLSEERQKALDVFFDKLAKKKMGQLQDPCTKSKMLAHDFSTYQHRYKVQKHIIALQKAKLEEQNRVIDELKYNKIIEASRQSVEAMREEIRKTYYEVDRQLKPRLKCLANELQIHQIEEPSLVLHCLKVPQFLQRMEKRAREREEKHALIRERRKQMEEERIRIKQQAELARAEMDKEEKNKRMIELHEKRKKEKIENIRKKQLAERIRGMIVMADIHYEKTLKMKYGLRPLRLLLELKKDNIEKAKSHYQIQLKNNVFLNWMWRTEDMLFERNYKAEDFYRKKILRKVFEGFKKKTAHQAKQRITNVDSDTEIKRVQGQIVQLDVLSSNHNEYVLKRQVAEDYYDLYLTLYAFRRFKDGIGQIRKENEEKLQRVVQYHNRAFTFWRTLPALNVLKREQEARKARWRQKVLQVVPDYTPPED